MGAHYSRDGVVGATSLAWCPMGYFGGASGASTCVNRPYLVLYARNQPHGVRVARPTGRGLRRVPIGTPAFWRRLANRLP